MYSFVLAMFAMAAGPAAHRQEGGEAGGVKLGPKQRRRRCGLRQRAGMLYFTFFADSHTQPLDQKEYQFLPKSLNSSDGGITVLSFSQQFFIKTTRDENRIKTE